MTDVTHLDNTLLSDLAACETRAVLRHIHGYTSKEDSAALFAGNAAHSALAEYFKGATVKEALRAFRLYRSTPDGPTWKAWATENIDPDDKFMGRLSYTNTRKIMKYWMEAHPMSAFPFTVEPEHVEVGFQFPLTKAGDLVIYGRMDAAPVTAREGGRAYVLDHKTTGQISSFWLETFKLSSQMTGYMWGVQQHTPERVYGVYINAIEFSKLPGLNDPTRKCRAPDHGGVTYEECQHLHVKSAIVSATRQPEHIKTWKRDAIRLGRRFQELKAEHEGKIENIHAASMAGTFNGNCRFCQFKEWCMIGRPLNVIDSMFKHEPWAPYLVEEKAS